jgi:hypothetical protein
MTFTFEPITYTIVAYYYLEMAENLMAKMVESVLGYSDQDRATNVDISNPDREGYKYADESREKMKALIWMGKNDVRIGLFAYSSIYMSIDLLTC